MKSWKDVPYLFTNGKFKVRYAGEHKIIGFCAEDLERKYESQFHIDTGKTAGWVDISLCTLIARPIEDMSNAELAGSFSDEFDQRDFPYWRNRLIDIANSGMKRMTASNLLHLLSIGVYPGPQTDFKDGKVVPTTTK